MRRFLLALSLVASAGCSLMIDPDGVEPPVPAKAVSSLAVSPATNDVPRGATAQLTATATYDDGTTGDVTAAATWSTSQASIATVSGGAVTAAASAGTAIISASLGGRFGNALVTAVAPAVASVSVTPTTQGLVQGLTQQLQASATYTDGTVLDVTSTATWSTSSAAIATVSSDGLVTASAPGGGTGPATITAAIGGRTATATITVTAPVVTSVAVAPVNATLQLGATQQFQAIASYDNATTQNVTASASWSSSAPLVASVNNAGSKGLVTGVAAGGPATITATFGARSGTAQVTVTSATVVSITIDRPSGSGALPKGSTAQLRATATYDDTTTADVTGQATWASLTPAVASVSDVIATRGQVTALAAAGTANITATFGGQTGSYPVAVAPAVIESIAVSAASLGVAKGLTEQLTATATYTDGTTADVTSLVTWTSGTTSVATVSATGLLTALTQGTSLLTATASGRSGSVTMTVLPPGLTGVALAPSPATLTVGGTVQMTLTASLTDGTTQNVAATATWSSDTTGVATVSATGLVSAVAAGSAVVTAQYGGFTRTSAVTVTGATVSSITIDRPVGTGPLPRGVSAQLRAMATYSDSTQQDVTDQATWTSGAPAVVGVSDVAPTRGLVTAVAASGSATITAAFGGRSGTFSVTAAAAAVESIAVTATSYSVPKGLTRQFTATATYTDGTTGNVSSTATWTSSATAVATVSAAGLATGQAEGSAFVRAQVGTVMGEATLTVLPPQLTGVAIAPASVTMAAAETLQVILTATYSDGSSQDVAAAATWSTNAAAAATVSATGLVTAVAAGSATITAVYGGYTRTVTVTVSAATVVSIAIDRPVGAGAIPKGSTAQLRATATYDDATTQDVTGQANWSSNPTSVATVSNATGSKGQVTAAAAAGTATITATFAGRSATFDVTAAPAVVASVAVTASSLSVAKGLTRQFTATATYTDATTANVSATATWASSNLAVATISATGLVTTLTQGNTDISATFDGVMGSATLAVTAPTIVSIAVSRPVGTGAIPRGATAQLEATATYTDGTTGSVTATATWTSSAVGVATVSDAAGTKGLVTAVAATGSATITAAVGPTSGTFGVTVTVAAIQSIAIEAPVTSLAVGETSNFVARATYTDSTTADVTTTANWTSSAPGVASVSTTNPTKGRVTAVSPSATPTVITAAVGTVSGTVSVTITPAEVSSVTITPASPVTAVGGTIQLHATATYTDGSSLEVTGSALTAWSGGGAIATVSDVIGSKGVVTGVVAGTATISAAFGGQVGSILVTVRTVASIAVTGYATPVPAGQTVQLTATATLTGGGTQDVTTSATWASANAAVATVSNAAPTKGLVTAVATSGTSSISATLGATGAQTVTVTNPVLVSIAVTGSATPIPDGTSVQLTATGTYSNATTANLTSTANWSSLDLAVATVSNVAPTKGLVTAEAVTGTAAIQASVGGIVGELTVSVTNPNLLSIAVTGYATPIPDGTNIQLTATGTYSNATTAVLTTAATWTSLSPLVATVDDVGTKGRVTAVASTGTARIQATVGVVTGEVTVSVTNPNLVSIAVTGYSTPIPAGTTIQLAAIGTFSNASTANLSASAIWTSLSPAVATVSQTPEGVVTAVATTGTARIRATVGVIVGEVTVTVTNPNLTSIAISGYTGPIPHGDSVQLTATGTYTNGTTASVTSSATWVSATPSVATVNDAGGKGLVTTVAPSGTSIIRATIGAIQGTVAVEAAAARLISITVTPANLDVPVGTHVQLTATGNYSDGATPDMTAVVNWWTTNGAVAQVGLGVADRGMFQAIGVGPVTVVASYMGTDGTVNANIGPVAPVRLDVTLHATDEKAPPFPVETLALSPFPYQATATVTYSDGLTLDVSHAATWASSDGGVATVSNAAGERGRVDTVGYGPVTFTGSYGGMSGALATSVSPPVLIFIVPLPSAEQTTLPPGTTVQFKALALQSDWSLVDISTSALWSSQDTAVATVENGPFGGRVTTVGPGSTLINISQAGFTASAALLVSGAAMTDFRIWPWPWSAPAVYFGYSDRLHAIAYYSDGSAVEVSAASTWTSLDETVATVDWEGQVTALRIAPVSVIADYRGFSTGAVPVDIRANWVDIQYPPPIPSGQKLRMRAIQWQQNVPVDVTDQMTWSSSDPTCADFLPGDPVGVVTATNAFGYSCGIMGTLGGQSYWANVQTTTSGISFIQVTPDPATAPVGATGRLTATIYYSTGGSSDVSHYADWFSDFPPVVSVSATDRGSVTANSVGGAWVYASLWGFQGSTFVNVVGSPVQAISVFPSPTATVPVGGTAFLTATAQLADATVIDVTNFAIWQGPSRSNVVWMDSSQPGSVHANQAGTAVVTASLGDVVGATTVEVGGTGVQWINWINAPTGTFYSGAMARFRAMGYLSGGGSETDVSEYVDWFTDTPMLVSVSNLPGDKGLVIGMGAAATGQAHVWARTASGQERHHWFWVELGTPGLPIVIQPMPASVRVGGTTQLQAYATVYGCSAGSCLADYTSVANWWSGDNWVAQVGNGGADNGQVTGLRAGFGAWIYADVPGFGMSSQWVDVMNPVPTGLSIIEVWDWMSPDGGDPCGMGGGMSGSYPQGANARFAACREYDNGRRYDVTEQCNWWTDNPAIAEVSSAPGAKGVVTTYTPGPFMLQIDCPGPSSTSYGLSVSGAWLDHVGFQSSVTFAHAGARVSEMMGGDMGSLDAVARYSDGSQRSIGRYASVVSSNPAVADIAGITSQGGWLIQANAAGATTFHVGYLGRSASMTVNVDDSPYLGAFIGLDTLMALFGEGGGGVEVPSTFPVGYRMALPLFGTDSIGFPWDATEQATWTSSNPAAISVSDAPGSKGLITALNPGYSTISATVDGVTATREFGVNGAFLMSLTFSPSLGAGPVGALVGPIQAIATYSDGSTFDVTEAATWASTGCATAEAPGLYRVLCASSNDVWIDYAGTPWWTTIAGF